MARLIIPFLCMASAAALHGICFIGDGSGSPGELGAFGLVAAIFYGLPIGVVAMIVSCFFRGASDANLDEEVSVRGKDSEEQ